MRIAAVSDIHGNLPALEAVIADIARRDVDQIANLGDSLSGPLWPMETAERLMSLRWPSLAGNHERQLLTLPPERMGPSDLVTAAVLSDSVKSWIASLPPSIALAENVLLCHGTPLSDHTYWLHKIHGNGMREATLAEIAEIAGDATDHALILCGHTHLPRSIVLSNGRCIANPGSVGLPAYDDDLPHFHKVETGTPHARYLTAEGSGIDGWQVELHTVAYDHESAAQRAEAMGRPTWATALRTGRVMP